MGINNVFLCSFWAGADLAQLAVTTDIVVEHGIISFLHCWGEDKTS